MCGCQGIISTPEMTINPFMPNVFPYPYQLDEYISNFRVVGWIFLFKFQKNLLLADNGESD